LMCLDPVAVDDAATRWNDTGGLAWLPDPVDAAIRDEWMSTPTSARRTILVFGVLDSRKGIEPLLMAATALSRSEQRQIRILLAGAMPPGTESLMRCVAGARKDSELDIVLHNQRIPDSQIQSLISQADVVSLLYQADHVGSSGVLIRAAAAGIPVIATDHGLVGHLARKYRLGVTVRSDDSHQIRESLSRWLSEGMLTFQRGSAHSFAATNTPERFVSTFYQTVLGL
jgi:glycosyltransferase involved in cell wall biosynthesis